MTGIGFSIRVVWCLSGFVAKLVFEFWNEEIKGLRLLVLPSSILYNVLYYVEMVIYIGNVGPSGNYNQLASHNILHIDAICIDEGCIILILTEGKSLVYRQDEELRDPGMFRDVPPLPAFRYGFH